MQQSDEFWADEHETFVDKLNTKKSPTCSCGQPIYADSVCLVNYMTGNCHGETSPPV